MIYKSKLKSSIVFTSRSPCQMDPSCHGGESQAGAAADMYSEASHPQRMANNLLCNHVLMFTWLGMMTPGDMQRILTLRVTSG